MLQAMCSLTVREEDVDKLPYFVAQRVKNIPQELRDAWDWGDFETAYLLALGHDKEIEKLCKLRGVDPQRIITQFCRVENISRDEVLTEAAFCGRADLLRLCKHFGYTDFNLAASKAAEGGHDEALRLCKEYGVVDFEHPLQMAVHFGKESSARICKEFGAKGFNMIAYIKACYGNEQAVNLCVRLGAIMRYTPPKSFNEPGAYFDWAFAFLNEDETAFPS